MSDNAAEDSEAINISELEAASKVLEEGLMEAKKLDKEIISCCSYSQRKIALVAAMACKLTVCSSVGSTAVILRIARLGAEGALICVGDPARPRHSEVLLDR